MTLKRAYISSGFPERAGWKSWTHNFEHRLLVLGREGGNPNYIRVLNGDLKQVFFKKLNGVWTNTNGQDTLAEVKGGWHYFDNESNQTSIYNNFGIIQERTSRNGWKYTYTHQSDGKVQTVTNAFGRVISFDYGNDPTSFSVRLNGNVLVNYQGDGANLDSVLYPDGTGEVYLYGSPGLITSITDAQGAVLDSFTYDSQARATSTSKPLSTEKYTIEYNSDGSVRVTNPLGNKQSYAFLSKYGDAKLTSLDKPNSAMSQPISGRSIGSDGLTQSETDFLGTTTTYQWDTTRRLPLTTTEAAGKPESRTTTTEWHPQWRLPVTVTEQGRVTSYTYDSRGNRLSQTIADTATNTARTTTWTYNLAGLVASETAPNGAVTSFAYDSAGNLTESSRGAGQGGSYPLPVGNYTRSDYVVGHVDAYTHDAAGRVLTHTAPSGLVTTYTYDTRGRMLTSNRGGQVTTLAYRPSGQVETVTWPHGYSITYTYDAAERLSGWSDNRGASGTYQLDAMGNRTREEVRNAQGQQSWLLARSISELNRVESISLGGQTTTYGYDSNGDWVRTTNGKNETNQIGLDALRRTKAITNAENATASLTYNALDAVTKAIDFKGVSTNYTRDALGNATTETSPDTGTETAQYDALGLPKTVTNALGQATTIERDLLGRPTLVTYADGHTTSLRYDLTANSVGTLGEIEDASGTTAYRRDQFGRVTTKIQRLINSDLRSVSYEYDSRGLLTSTTYPGGQVLQYLYDTTGQITGLTWAGQPLVTGITWNPLGQPTGWSWSLPGGAAPIPATRSYNAAGQVTATDFSSYQYDAAGRITSLTQNLWHPASTNPQDSTLTQATSTWTVQYSPAGRIIGFTKNMAANAPVDTATFQYDANGNRTASTRGLAGTTTSRTYGGDASHNRLLGFEQTTASTDGNSATTSVTYQYNTAGDLLGDGLTTYRYDSEGRMESASTGQGEDAPTTKYAHNGLGQRVFKTEPLYSSTPASGSSNKNLNNLLADDDEPQGEPPGLIQQILSFFSKLWSPSTSDAEKLGFSYVYAEDGSLLGEYGSGGSNSTGTAQYIYLPTASGPMPIAAVIKGTAYAVHSDHLNTPRKLTQPDGQVAWQWAYSAFGDEQPTIGAKRFTSESTNPTTGATSIPEVTFNLRYPGQYFDKETKLHYNYFRTYAPGTGRYTQGDPIGLDGGWNRFAYVRSNPFLFFDPFGLRWIIDPANRAPEDLPYNTLFCNGENPEPYTPPQDESCSAIRQCAIQHERTHISHALAENPEICKGNSKRIIIVNDEKEPRLESEAQGVRNEIRCLQKAFEDDCESNCKSRINSRINVLKWILENQINQGNYP
ncbi:RHS repeat protein [Acidovorax sp. ACV01]|nr:RHS repeat protein [Acidovorax sp. ACV01]